MKMTDCYLDAAEQYGKSIADMLLNPSTETRNEAKIRARALVSVAKSLTPEQAKNLDSPNDLQPTNK
jgi:hypothetical protein